MPPCREKPGNTAPGACRVGTRTAAGTGAAASARESRGHRAAASHATMTTMTTQVRNGRLLDAAGIIRLFRSRPIEHEPYLGGSTTMSQVSCLGTSNEIPDVSVLRNLG